MIVKRAELSEVQKGIFVDCQIDSPDSYNISATILLKDLNEKHLENAFSLLVKEQAALRSTVEINEDDMPQLVVHDQIHYQWERENMTVSHSRASDELDEVIKNQLSKAFSLFEGPLFRVKLVRLTDDKHAFIICLHHIISDGMSMEILKDKLTTYYEQLLNKETITLEQDEGLLSFMEEENNLLQSGKYEKDKHFWLENMKDAEPLELPFDYSAHTTAHGTGEEVAFKIPHHMVQKVQQLAQKHEVTDFMFFLSVFGLLMQKYTQEKDIVFSSPFAHRENLDYENTVGNFVSMLPIRLTVEENESPKDLFRQVFTSLLQIYKHAKYPNNLIMRDNDLVSMPGSPSVFDISFVYDVYDDSSSTGISTEIYNPKNVTFPGNLMVVLNRTATDDWIKIQYKKDVFKEETVKWMGKRFIRLLETIIDNPDIANKDINIRLPEEEGSILHTFNQTAYFPYRPETIIDIFHQKMETFPDRLATLEGENEETYATINEKANQLAYTILENKQEENDAVGIQLERSTNLIISLLAVLKSGCCYVPFDLDYPLKRKEYIVQDANISQIITTADHVHVTPSVNTIIDVNDQNIYTNPTDNPNLVRNPHGLAYIIYTSGSTGNPKGVMVENHSVVNTLKDLDNRFPMEKNDRYLLKTPFTFDVAATELYGWFMGEGTLSILAPGGEKDPEMVLEEISRQQITHVNFVPSMFRLFMDRLDSEQAIAKLSPLKWIFVGGEAITTDLLRKFHRLGTNISLENVYGPTETTIWVSHQSLPAEKMEDNVSIGRPLNENRWYVVDNNNQLQPIGIAGELCISGVGLARGYLNQDDLTKKSFIPNPFYNEKTDQDHYKYMYKTGDLARWLPDGAIEFIGRKDFQVKVRGIRLETEEIEKTLADYESIIQAVVVIKEDTNQQSILCAYYLSAENIPENELTAYLAKHIPAYMIPSFFIHKKELPHNSSGKIDRNALINDREHLKSKELTKSEAPKTELEKKIAQVFEEVLSINGIGLDDNFFQAGGTSLSLIQLHYKLEKSLHQTFSITVLMRSATVRKLAAHFQTESEGPIEDRKEFFRSSKSIQRQDIAIIGMSVNVPGAENIGTFWRNLVDEKESIHFYSDEELEKHGYEKSVINAHNYVKAKGRINGVDHFDADFFNYTPGEVRLMSPQLRLLFRGAWEAMEDAGYYPGSDDSKMGIYLGGSDDFEWYRQALLGDENFSNKYESFTLSTNHFLATRLAHNFNVKGPAYSALTGCSTTLVTPHLACQSLMFGECDIAIAGGITIEMPNEGGYFYERGMMFSPDGHCRPFDADAEGTVFSNGMGIVVLKRLDEALRDGDNISAVIKGSAINNDGDQKVGFTAPSVDGQREVIQDAYKSAQIDPETVSYVEAHGTGTAIGDPIEIESLTQAFASSRKQFCKLGSVKGNIGHTDTAAGAVGMVKAALSLKHKYLPGTVNYNTANPKISFEATPFTLNAEGQHWEQDGPLRAGINSFGIGGTNAHMILEEAPKEPHSSHTDDNDNVHLLVFSAKSQTALKNTSSNVLQHLHQNSADIDLSDAAWTLQVGRKKFPYRKSIVWDEQSPDSLEEMLQSFDSDVFHDGEEDKKSVYFMFPGQGSQYQGMARELYHSASENRISRLFKHHLDTVFNCLDDNNKAHLKEIIFGDSDPQTINETENSQFAIFSISYALAKTMISIGVEPKGMIGHSIGELVAATIGGVFTLPDAVDIVLKRGKIMQKQKQGVMLAVMEKASIVEEKLTSDVWLSLDNSSSSCVVGGTHEGILSFEKVLKNAGMKSMRLKTSHAFHTPMMEEASSEFSQFLKQCNLNEPAIPILANGSGTWNESGDLSTPAYWSNHILQTVRFADSLDKLLAEEDAVFIEVGAGRSLISMTRQHQPAKAGQTFINLLPHPKEKANDVEYFNEKIGKVWETGVFIDWSAWKGETVRKRISLPTYVFDQMEFPVSLSNTEQEMPADNQQTSDAMDVRQQRSSIKSDSELKQAIISAYQTVFGFDDIQEEQDFFELGGDSLKAVSLSSSIKANTDIDIDISDLFKHTTPGKLALHLQDHVDEGESVQSIVPLEKRPYYPLSSAQERMYALYLLDKDSLAYNLPSVTIINGILDHKKIEQALEKLIQRHESLRTSFEMKNNNPVQIVHDRVDVPITYIEQKISGDDETDAFVDRFVEPFQLENAPLFRVALVKCNDQKHILFLDFHHIIADGTSVEIITRDFNDLYFGTLPVPDIHYKDFAAWQTDLLQSSAMDEDRNYWMQVLSEDEVPVLSLPTDFERPPVKDFKGSRVHFKLDKQLTEKLTALSKETNTTLYMVLLSVWQILLGRYANQEDIIVGTPVAGRTTEEVQDTVGMFINMLAMRNYPIGEKNFADYLQEVKTNALNAFEHQDYQFDQLVEQLDVTRELNRNALFDVCFDFQNMDLYEPEVEGISFTPYRVNTTSAAYDLVMTCEEDKNNQIIDGFLEYATGLFKEETIERMVKQFEFILETIVDETDMKIADIDIVPNDEKKLLADFNATDLPYDASRLEKMFLHEVQKHPDKTALILADGHELTYRDLNERANALAWHLVDNGIKPGSLVGIMCGRNEDLFISLLAVLKSGGAYVPIDPAFPADRKKYMLNESNAHTLICASKREMDLDFAGEIIDNHTIKRLGKRKDGPEVAEGIDSLASVIFTSGSTGSPKGVMIKQRSIVNFIHDVLARGIFQGQSDRVISVTTLSFDIFGFESFAPLCTGHSIYLADEAEQIDAHQVAEKIVKYHCTHILSTVSRIKAFVENPLFDKALKQLTCILSGGEHYPEQLLRELQTKSEATLYNMYGPTETTIWSTTNELTNADTVSIGMPIANTKAFIVNQSGMLQPVGVHGELCIAGEGLAKGYLNNPEETEDKFITLPFVPRMRVYRTGDRARIHSNGEIELMGRLDSQVKIRGYRVEIHEIEHVLLSNENIREAIVLPDGEGNEKRLILYYCIQGNADKNHITHQYLRKWMETRLPSYAIPSQSIWMEDMPVLPNGKIDRNALPAPEKHTTEEYREQEVDRSDLEQSILEIWKRELNVNHIQMHDNFFDAGGNSLAMIRVNNALNAHLNESIPLMEMFEHPTIASMAAHIQQNYKPVAIEKDTTIDHQETHLSENEEDIAVIGMAGQFPGASDVNEYWENIKAGKESITVFTDEELQESGISKEDISKPNYVKAKGYLENVEHFDNEFFDYPYQESNNMDPQMRLLHQNVWEVLESAGYRPSVYDGLIGLFAGSGSNVQWVSKFMNNKQDILNAFEALTLNEKDFLTSRISYKMNLKGPSYNVQTACSTSLVAIHQAVQSLKNKESDMAIAGGVTVSFPRKEGYLWHEGMIFSKDGHCRAFSDDATGTVSGNGSGVVLLKPLSAAKRDGDTIYAVVKGSAINNDGYEKVGYTAPSIQGQTNVIKKALQDANLKPESLDYVEAHGTGTSLGDPIEIEALKQAWGTTETNYCAIGSVKANIGHLDAAAGVAGFIKSVLTIYNREIPPQIHYNQPNRQIDFRNSPFYINKEINDVPESKDIMRAGVSSFGIGGTNAHIILEENVEKEPLENNEDTSKHLFVFSGKSRTAVDNTSTKIMSYLKENKEVNLKDAAWTLQVGREPFRYRKTVTLSRDTLDALSVEELSNVAVTQIDDEKNACILLFLNEQSLYQGIGSDLYSVGHTSSVANIYRKHIDEVLSHVAQDEKQYIYDVFDKNKSTFSVQSVTENRLAIFAVGYALAKTLLDLGIKPDAYMGQNAGEISAVTVSGILRLSDALDMIRTCGDWIAYQEGGMIASYLISGQMEQNISDSQVIEKINAYNLNQAQIPIIASHPVQGENNAKSVLSVTEVMNDKGVFVELGSAGVLSNIMKQLLGQRAHFINAIPKATEQVNDTEHVYKALGAMWSYGIHMEWEMLYGNERRKRIALPTYVFDHIYHDSDVILNQTANGEKVKDQKADTDIEQQQVMMDKNDTADNDQMEAKLKELWCNVLGCADVSRDDDFFDMGGHSLKAITLVSDIEQEFSVDIPLSDMFNHSVFKDLVLYIQANANEEPVSTSIVPVEKKEYYEVSSAQKRMYIVHEMIDDGLPYNLAASYYVDGDIDHEKFQYVMGQLVNRHEAFRTSFHMIDGEVFQKVHENVPSPVEFETIDASEVGQKTADFIKPFDLSQAPLMRVKLMSYDSKKHVLAIDMHHIISDQSSIAILLDEIKSLYAGNHLSPLSYQYKDFASWQNTFFETDEYAEKMAYWKNEFKGDIPHLDMLTDFKRPEEETFAGENITFDFGSHLNKQINDMSKELGITPFMVLMGALKIVLWKYANQKDVVVGTGVSGRSQPEVDSIVGMFVNTLAIRTQIDEASTFKDFLLYIKEKMLQAYDHQDCQYEMLVESLDVNTEMGRNPLFDVVMNYINMGTDELALEGLSLKPMEHETVDAKFDITWTILENDGHFTAELEYRTSLFKRESMELFGQRLLQVVSELTGSFEAKQLKDVSILTDKEHHDIHDLNQTKTDAPLEQSIIELFEETVQAYGDNDAIQWEGSTLTYDALNAYVNEYALKIQEESIKTGSPIAVLLDRGPEQIISILAVLKTGCIYVPIDPTIPEERIQYILKDSGAMLVLTNRRYQSMIKESTNSLLLDDITAYGSFTAPTENVRPKGEHVTGNDTAYIMYTSGSTGKPKGTIIRHKNIIRVVRETNYIDIKPSDRLLQLSNYSFDGSTFDIYGALLNGAGLVMVPDEIVIEVSSLAALIKEQKITVFFITTALFNVLVDWDITCLENVRTVLFGGEETSVQHVQKAFEYLGPGRLVNVYGPTESTVFSTFYPINECDDETEIIPIGYPVSNTTVYVLDENGHVVPPNIPGELYIGGSGLAEGYINRDDLTKEKFIYYPDKHGERVYRTGDIVWRKSSGEICFIGRADFQVKIRGFRIELGEIENRIRSIDGIKEVLVVTKKDKTNNDLILAYFTADQKRSGKINTAEIKKILSNKLPAYMVPARVKEMDKMPLNINGKIDRKALPSFEAAQDDDDKLSDGNTEEIILKQMRDVLDYEGLGLDDNFFEYGGQSLKAISLVQSLSKMNISRKVNEVFQYPTANQLSDIDKNKQPSASSGSKQTLLKTEDSYLSENAQETAANMLKDVQKQNKTLSQTVTSAHVTQTFSLAPVQKVHYGLEERNSGFMTNIQGFLTENDVKTICAKVIAQHQLLHSVIGKRVETSNWNVHDISQMLYTVQKQIPYVSATSLEYEDTADVLQRLASGVFQMAYADGELPWRIACFQVDENTHTLIWGFDHIAFDGMSAEVLKSEIESETVKMLQSNDETQQDNMMVEATAYSDYVNHVIAGPVNITEDSIIDTFSLTHWNEQNKTFMNTLNAEDKERAQEVNISLPINGDTENIWEDSFQKLTEILCKYTGINEIPISLVHYGRHYQNNKFYDCVGEFLDVIPMLMTMENQERHIQTYIEFCRKHSINFLALLMDEHLKRQYPKIHRILERNLRGTSPNKEIVMVNFQGYVSKEESDMFEQESEEVPESRMAKLYVTISYDDTELRIQLDSYNGLDESRIKNIADSITGHQDDVDGIYAGESALQ